MNTVYTHTPTPLMSQQVVALERAAGRKVFAFLMEQGTGKTLTVLEEVMRLYAAGEIDCCMVLAPNGVQENWILTEIPLHVPETLNVRAAYYVSDPNRREKKAMESLMTPRAVGETPPLRFLACNYEALLTDSCFKFCESFIRSGNCYIVADESQKIKGHDSRRTKRAINLRKQAKIRRVATGTMIGGEPMDAFPQMQFLEDGLLGTDSLVAFRKEYCHLLPPDNGLMRHIVERKERAMGRKMTPFEKEVMLPPVIERDARGMPMYRNLDKLQALIAQHSYRALKEECLDLPPKTYSTRFFHLTKAQRKIYDRMEDELRYILEDETVLTTSRLVAMAKLRQITSGFLLMRDGTVSYLEDNPRIELLSSEVEDFQGQGIIWSQFKEEQRNIERMLREQGKVVETVNGDVPMGRRRAIRLDYQAGNIQWINAHPETLGTGFTLTRCTQNIFYSNGFKLIERIQAEDRSHRIGTKETVDYRDFVAIDTRDDNVVWALQHKLDVAAMIQGDPNRKSRFILERETA